MIFRVPSSPPREYIPFTTEALEQSIQARFEEIVRRLPDHIAVKFEETAVSYAELNATANRLARTILTHAGTEAEAIAILLGRGISPVAAMLAVLKAGNCCVPLDPSFPRTRIRTTIEHSNARLLITDQQNVELAREVSGDSCKIVEFESVDPFASPENLHLPVGPSSFAAILYTSGSTGEAKGVLLDHRALLHNGMRQAMVASVGMRDRVTLLTAATANAVSTTFSTLFAGATLLPFDVSRAGVSRMAQWLGREQVSIALIAAPLFRRFCANLRGDECFPDLRVLRLTSESVYRTDLDLYKKHFSATCTFLNGLNASEMGPVSACCMNHQTILTDNDVPVGYALPGIEVLLLDESGHPVAFNEVGEIAIRSRYLSRGYWRRPDLTSAKFKPDPAGGDAVVYLTGDAGLMLPDGCLVHKGRKDFRVKIRGHGVDVVEVQKQVLSHPHVVDAVVVPLKNEMGELELVAYFTSHVQPAPTVSAFRRFLKEKLPAHMVPSLYVLLGAMPLTPNGKINRAALPAPDRSAAESESLHTPPQNAIEGKLLEIWMRVLRVGPIGTSDDFFDLGGDSLAAVELIAAVEKEFGINLVPGTLVDASSIGRLARHIASERDRSQVRRGNLVQLQRGITRRPIFFVPGGVGGDAEFFVYTRLARHVGTKFPFYGLRARSADGTESAQATVEQMATDYIGAMKSVQPQGPYCIIGECAGGIVAYEIAQQLYERGQQIAILMLMDTTRPDWSLEARRKVRRIVEPVFRSHRVSGLVFLWDQLRRRTGLDKAKYLVSKSGIIARETLRRERTASSQPVNRAIEYVQRSYSRAIYAYRPKPYPGTMTLLVHDEFRKNDKRAMLGWSNFVSVIELHALPGSHLTYIRDHVDAVAAQIRECIERADTADTSPASRAAAGRSS